MSTERSVVKTVSVDVCVQVQSTPHARGDFLRFTYNSYVNVFVSVREVTTVARRLDVACGVNWHSVGPTNSKTYNKVLPKE